MTSGGGQSRRSSARPAATRTVAATQRIDALLAGIPERGNALGSPTAPVTLQFFGDLECPTSREFTVGALPSLIDRWVRGGDLRIEYRSLETATREPAVFTTQQVAALAAGMQDRLWYYLELFYQEQGREDSGYVTESYLRGLARQAPGLSLELWSEDRKDPQLPAQVSGDERAAAGQGFHSTPSFLIGRTGSGRPVKLLEFSTIEPAAFNREISRFLAEAKRQARAGGSIGAGSGRGRRVAVADRSADLADAGEQGATC
jgi:protein-disulfide isomerase